MSVSTEPVAAVSRRPASLSFLKLAGPGLVVAATGIGSGDVVAATVGGARYGVILLWAIAVGAFFKYVLNEGIARWQLATGKTALEGWAEYLPAWVKWYFGVYLVLWTVFVTAALTNATGLGISNLTGGRIAQSWGGVLHSLFGFVFVLLGGYGGFEKMMKTLVGVMGFSILVCAALTFHDPAGVLQGTFVPKIPPGAGLYVLSIIGGIGGSVTMLSYNYWMREEKLAGPEKLGYVRGDIAIAYLFTALFGMAIMMTANQAFYVPGVAITNAQAVTKMAEMLGSILGMFGRYAYSIGFWAAVFASLLGVWQSVPYLYADFYSILKKLPAEERARVTKVTSTPVSAGACLRHAGADTVRVYRPAAGSDRRLHDRRESVRAVPRGDAVVSEQSREVDGRRAAQQPCDQRAPRHHPRAVRNRRGRRGEKGPGLVGGN